MGKYTCPMDEKSIRKKVWWEFACWKVWKLKIGLSGCISVGLKGPHVSPTLFRLPPASGDRNHGDRNSTIPGFVVFNPYPTGSFMAYKWG